MIKINLLPVGMRPKSALQLKLPWLKVAMIGGVIFGLITVGLYIDYCLSRQKLKKLKREWVVLEPRSTVLNKLKSAVEGDLRPEATFIQQMLLQPYSETRIFSKISENLPGSVWLNEIESDHLENPRLIIKGSCSPTSNISCIEQIEGFSQKINAEIPAATLKLTTSLKEIKGLQVTEFVAAFLFPTTKGTK